MIIEFPPPKPKDYKAENVVVAMLGIDLAHGVGGFGDTVPDAFRDLATNMEREGWHPRVVT